MGDAGESRGRRAVRALRDAAVHNLPLKLLALALAIGLWAFVNFGERDSEEALKVPVELRQIPASLMITSPRIDFVDVRVVGPRTLLGRIDHTQLLIPLDLSGALPGPAVFTVNVDRLNLPRGVRVTRVTPAQITVTLETIGRKTVPVELLVEGEPPADFRIVSTAVDPPEVAITGPESVVESVESVVADVVRLDDASRETIRREVPVGPLGEYVKTTPGAVAIEIVIEEIVVERRFDEAPISVMATGAREVQIEPAQASVVVAGPRRLVEPLESGALLGIDAAGLSVGAHIARLVANLPEGVTLLELDPEEVTVTVMAPTPPPDVETPQATPLEGRR